MKYNIITRARKLLSKITNQDYRLLFNGIGEDS